MLLDNVMLPKLCLAVIPEYWYKKLPDESTYPATTTAFSLNFSDEIKDIVKDMEEKLGTDESIIKSDDVAKGTTVSTYMGTYDVEGVVNEEVLISPVKVPSGTVSVLAYHYVGDKEDEEATENNSTVSTEDEESTPVDTKNGWEKIDATIKDGYVYATMESFSPIAIFAIKKAPYVENTLKIAGKLVGKYIVANGTPVVIKQVNGKFEVTDCYGTTTTYPTLMGVVGGTTDGSYVESTSITVIDVDKAFTIDGSSVPASDTEFSKVGTVNVTIKNCAKSVKPYPVYPGCKAKTVNVVVENSHLPYIGSCASILNGKDVNGNSTDELSLAKPSTVEYANYTIKDSTIEIFYAGGISGRTYTVNASLIAENTNFGQYFTTGGSNGKTDNVTVDAVDCTFGQYQTVNRGTVKSSIGKLKNCVIEHCYVGTDSRDDDADGTIDKVYMNFTGGTVAFGIGRNGGEDIDDRIAAKIIDAIKVSPSTKVSYLSEEDKNILEERILLKQRN